MKVLNNIFRYLLIALVLAAGLVVMMIAVAARLLNGHRVQAALPASQQQPARVFDRVHFDRCTGQVKITEGKIKI